MIAGNRSECRRRLLARDGIDTRAWAALSLRNRKGESKFEEQRGKEEEKRSLTNHTNRRDLSMRARMLRQNRTHNFFFAASAPVSLSRSLPSVISNLLQRLNHRISRRDFYFLLHIFSVCSLPFLSPILRTTHWCASDIFVDTASGFASFCVKKIPTQMIIIYDFTHTDRFRLRKRRRPAHFTFFLLCIYIIHLFRSAISAVQRERTTVEERDKRCVCVFFAVQAINFNVISDCGLANEMLELVERAHYIHTQPERADQVGGIHSR